MRKPTLTFVAVTTAATLVIGYLFLQLRAERNAATQLREHVAQLSAATEPAGSTALSPQPTAQASPSIASTVHETPPTAPIPDEKPSPTMPLALFSTEIRKELGLTEEEGKAFVELLRNNASEAQFVALVGADRYQQYQESQRAAARQQRVNHLRTSLADTRHPLTDAQAAQVDLLLDAEQRRRAADAKARVRPTEPRALLEYDEATLTATRAATERMVADANGFLSVEQAAVLQSQLGSTVSQQMDHLRTRRAQLDAGGR